jgi:hypothetical protein
MACIAPASAAGATVDLRGTAYEFNKPAKRLAGATIRVAEHPRLRATVRANGEYRLAVPDGARVTPYIEVPGYHTIYLQTFTTAGQDLDRVNFQVPTDGTYDALAALLKVPLDAAGNVRECAIVSTFSTRDVRALSFGGFVRYGAHGVAGATASATPALPSPFYFNAQVIPDPAQRRSSKDGGVIWTGVRAGRYVIRGHHPRTRFASFVATCKPGRIVNANPPWGLHELGRANRARIGAHWTVSGTRTGVRSLRATRLPSGAKVRIACLGKGCPIRTRTLRPRGRSANLTKRIPSGAVLRAGQLVEVSVVAPGYDGVRARWTVRQGRTPWLRLACIPLGMRAPASCTGG